MEPPQTSELEAYAESLYPARFGWSPLKTLQEGRFKLIDAPRPELYDLERDPFEERNIHAERPTVADAMRRRLTQMANESEAPDGLAPADELSPDARERLHALGYIGARPRCLSPRRRPAGPEGLCRAPSGIQKLRRIPLGGAEPSCASVSSRGREGPPRRRL